MTASVVTFPSHGSLSGLDGNSFYYTLSDTTFVGTDSFTYRACDPQQACSNIATVTINVVNQPPVANDDAYTVHVNGTIGPLRVNDSDPDGDSLKAPEILTFPSHGTLFGLPDPDKKSYSANQGYVGPDSFTYRVCDSLNLCSAPATVTINVVNQLPVAVDDAYTLHGTGIIGPLLLGQRAREQLPGGVVSCNQSFACGCRPRRRQTTSRRNTQTAWASTTKCVRRPAIRFTTLLKITLGAPRRSPTARALWLNDKLTMHMATPAAAHAQRYATRAQRVLRSDLLERSHPHARQDAASATARLRIRVPATVICRPKVGPG